MYTGSAVDANCNTICLFGGLAGTSCPNWNNTAEFIETVWIDNR